MGNQEQLSDEEVGQMSSPELHVYPGSERSAFSLTDLFHRINRVLPVSQKPFPLRGETLASEALKLLGEHRCSQLPVWIGEKAVGIFSYRSFTTTFLDLCSSKNIEKALLRDVIKDLTVKDSYEPADFALVTDEFHRWFDALNDHNAVLVGEPHLVHGVLTPMVILRYLYKVAKPFVLVAEIETCLRALLLKAVTAEQLAECARRAHSGNSRQLHTQVEEMTFGNYVYIVGNEQNWPLLEPWFGGRRDVTMAKLEMMNELRNIVFHLRRFRVGDREQLAGLRDWMLMKAREAESRASEGNR